MCFNGAKSYATEWYSDNNGHLDLTPGKERAIELVGIDDYLNGHFDPKVDTGGQNQRAAVIVRIQMSSADDLYIMYNRKKGVNSEVVMGGDKVTIVSQISVHRSQSWLEATLDENSEEQRFTTCCGDLNGYCDSWARRGSCDSEPDHMNANGCKKSCGLCTGTCNDLVVKTCDRIAGPPDVARVIVYLDDGVNFMSCDDFDNTPSPSDSPSTSAAPSKIPSAAPTRIPSTAPTSQVLCRADLLSVQTATASSIESNHFVPDWAVDGDPNSRWASDGPGADGASEKQWVKFDLGGHRFIDSINLEWERAYSRNYEIQISDTGEDDNDDAWKSLATFSDAIGGAVEESMLDDTASYVRILSHQGDSNYGISLYEVKIFGDSHGDCIPGPPTCRQKRIDAAEAFASSEEGSHYGPEKAIDGDMHTRWSSKFEDDEWFIVDLGAMTLVYSVWLFWERAYAGSYALQTGDSLTGSWTTIFETNDSDGEVDIIPSLHHVTQYVRLLSTDRATRYGNSLREFEVRGTQEEGCI
jgi:hypothetical protein